MMTFNEWTAAGRPFDPDYAQRTFGWKPLALPVDKVYVYPGMVFVEILLDGTPIFGGVAMGDRELAQEAAFQWYRARGAA
jgi:hypothetical protein